MSKTLEVVKSSGVARYVAKPYIVEAIQVLADDGYHHELELFCGPNYVVTPYLPDLCSGMRQYLQILLRGTQKRLYVGVGDFLVRGELGEITKWDALEFANKYSLWRQGEAVGPLR